MATSPTDSQLLLFLEPGQSAIIQAKKHSGKKRLEKKQVNASKSLVLNRDPETIAALLRFIFKETPSSILRQGLDLALHDGMSVPDMCTPLHGVLYHHSASYLKRKRKGN